ncbi:MAG: phenylacetate--CoA ligase family protein [Acidobacteria bacterium]|nr:phenylacetate--CoA ligase family protein [Acidobacteriota bacterium]
MTTSRFNSREIIEQRQQQQLRALLDALSDNRFYLARLRAAAVTPQVSLSELNRIPFTFRQEIADDQRHHPPYGTNLSYPLERYTRFSQTSGTSGSPLYWLDTPESWNWMLNCWTQVFKAAAVGPRDKFFFAFSFAPFLGFWTAFDAAVKLGALSIPGGGLSSVARLGMICENATTVLCCTPTYALHLAEVAKEEGFDLSSTKISKIIVAGEPGGSIPNVRMRIEASWNAVRVIDHHGMTETGPVSYQCSAVPDVLHILESDFIAEVIDPQSGQRVAPGQTGELVLTNLGRLGSPVLRYRTSDLVKRSESEPCMCGSHEMALQGGILGRTDDMVTVRGVNIYPAAVEEIVRSCQGVGEYRVVFEKRRELAEVTLEVEPSADCQDPSTLGERVRKMLGMAFTLRIPVSIVPAGSLPRFEMKAKRWVKL